MVKTRSNTRGIKPLDKQKQNFSEKKRNKSEKTLIGGGKIESFDKSIGELLKLCRPVRVNLKRCVLIASNSSKFVFSAIKFK